MDSVFSIIPEPEWVASNPLAFAIRDSYPVTRGHTLVITRRIVPTWFEATQAEQHAVMSLVDEIKLRLDVEFAPDGYNVGFNAGQAAGQTVPHLHVHVIPRYVGDLDDPRGGVRHVIPHRGNYKRVAADWSDPPGPKGRFERVEPLTTGDKGRGLGGYLDSLFRQAGEVALVAAFVQKTGVARIEAGIEDVLDRGGQIQLVTGDYLGITDPDALQRLLDLQGRAAAFRALDEDEPSRHLLGSFEARVVETERLGKTRAFHPKAWIFAWGGEPRDGVAYVGSSNISASALGGGIEWNLRVERRLDPVAYDSISGSFEALWQNARSLTPEWLERYRLRARPPQSGPRLGPLKDEQEPEEPPVTPSDVQTEALDALRLSRAEGRRRALIVLATGLGKTFLAAFDVQAFERTLGRPPRVLFVAHRRELLAQAARTFRRVFPSWSFGWFVGSASELDGDVVFASVQKLGRHLSKLHPETFDYVIVDEVHHAAARSYRRILGLLEPAFLLGLTATPDRADEADILGFFDDHLPFRVDLGEGISRDLLVPFAYQGLKDTTDYRPIPWRNRSFNPDELARAVQTQERMQTLWRAWEETPGARSLVFCASIPHALFVRDWLAARGVRIEAVYSGPGSFDRTRALTLLAGGELDALCTVDLFNEGIDVKEIDRVVMLRPTESQVVFLQQLGRGLRVAQGKARLQVIDFVGNHRVFLDRVRTLLSLTESAPSLRSFLTGDEPPALPAGCSVEIELEAIDLLERLLPAGSRNELVRGYRELNAARGQRPTAGELVRMNLNPASVRKAHKSWFGFVRDEGDLTDAEQRALETNSAAGSRWLRHLETTAMSKCFKMVVLEVLSDADALEQGMALPELARRSHALLVRSPALLQDLEGVKALGDLHKPDPEQWLRYWTVNPVQAWTKGEDKPWFAVEGERLVSRLPFPKDDPEAAEALCAMTMELVDWRLAIYRRRTRAPQDNDASSFEMKVLTNTRHPILHFGSRQYRDQLPTGETDVRLDDGALWSFRFVKVACNLARPVGEQRNRLPDLLYRWFGPDAGKAGTDLRVRFERSPDGWCAEPVGAQIVTLPSRGFVVSYADLRAAAGASFQPQRDPVAASPLRLPLPQGIAGDEEIFAIRASGHSMDGGPQPIRDGDWVLMRWARGLGLGAIEGRVALVASGDPTVGQSHHLKRVVKGQSGFELRSDNPDFPPSPVNPEAVVLARLVGLVRPEDLAPPVGRSFELRALQGAFGLSKSLELPFSRVDGHLFLFVEETPIDAAHIYIDVPDRRPGETAFVLTTSSDGRWRYAGVARQKGEGIWSMATSVG